MLDNKASLAAKGIYTLAESLRASLIKKEAEEAERPVRR
jgi:hypothetical protein